MKICFLMVSHWTGTLGGAEVQVRYLMEYLQENTEHELSMICRHTNVTKESGAPIYRASSLWPFGRYFIAADFLSVRRLLSKIQPDVVYTRVGSPYVGIAARYCKTHRKKLIYHIAHIDDVTPMRIRSLRRLPKRIERPIFEYGMRRADIVIAQAKYQAELLQKHFNRTAAAVIPNFHPTPTTISKSDTSLSVVWVANLKPAKQPEVFVRLAQRCAHLKRVKFVMVGAVQDRLYQGFAEKFGDVSNLEIVGPRSLEDVNKLLGLAHLFVNTSRLSGEGFPNTFIQAWLRATPVASLEVNPDKLLTSVCCGICAQGSLDKLVEITHELLEDRDRLRELGEQSRKFAESRYSLNNCAKISSLIDSLQT
jgi:glycosyltransferase involved in cell wall biosynthesis